MAHDSARQKPAFPNGLEFAFTILDDTDDTTVENGRPVYDLLSELGLRTTKTVWALDTPLGAQGPFFAAETLQNSRYLEWVHQLSEAGFEIAFHNASMGSSTRDKTRTALEMIAAEFPQMPRVHCNHAWNRENLHWGPARYSSPELFRILQVMSHVIGTSPSEGHIEKSEYYWEDLAFAKLDYVRRFTFLELDCGKIPPGRPYFDDRKPGIRCWFNTADASNVKAFRNLVTSSAIDKVRANRSWCIVSTHFGKDFARRGRVDPSVRSILEYIASLPGWFVPVSVLLDHLVAELGKDPLGAFEMRRTEYAHLLDRLRARITGRRSPRGPNPKTCETPRTGSGTFRTQS